MSEITINVGGMGESLSLNIVWRDENGLLKSQLLEIEVLNVDKPRTLRMLLDGKVISTNPQPLPNWCEHISRNLEGKFCYNGFNIGHWVFCPKCGVPKPSEAIPHSR